MKHATLFVVFMFIGALGAFADPSADLITKLPGLNDAINFTQYAGYHTVNASHGRRLFYWFVESQNDPANDPVVLWLNGGPGCSSLLGFFTEHGPFIPNSDGETLSINPYSWNLVANMIYLESPSGVGFSYSDTPADYTTGDFQTANDSYTFLLQFFQDFPQFQGNDFWVTGESYGGHYVPELALRIYDGNLAGAPKINLKGFMVGNGWTVPHLENYGAAYYWYTHAIISESTFNGLNATCNFSDIGPILRAKENADFYTINPLECDDYQNISFVEMGNINIYDIYQDVCLSNGTSNQAKQLMKYIGSSEAPLNTFFRMHDELVGEQQAYPPCVENYLTTYLNNPDVQAAIHANISYPWAGCSSIVNYSRPDLLTPILDIYRTLVGQIEILVFSGDVDAIVPITGTRLWLDVLNLPITSPFAPWTAPDGQVGGYVTIYDGLTFTSVRNAGHMVAGTQPLRALTMFANFLQGVPFK
eukprot:TRINITY_DN1073_c0_g1_i1.p1 TRINITY_DN1073_c0_g1~~TRINITY_DN1073_c0_g1_i1.p1  ORF type:complete len:491 (-),score=101.97 TRINITY_DN1073_c0_g1_i1:72-1496(-)